MIAVTFLSPSRLWLFVVVIALVAGYIGLQVRRRAYAVRFTNVDLLRSVAPKQPGWRRHLPAVFLVFALSSMVVAVARPARTERVPRQRATVILAIDCSLSMEATDVVPTRIKAAQKAAESFLDIIPGKINVGLVSFTGSATVLVAPTTDHDKLRQGIESLQLGERTAIGEAIFASLDAIKLAPKGTDGKPAPARIVLMSDGETTVGRGDATAAAAAAKAHVPVSTIAFGTNHGTITLRDPDTGEMETEGVAVNKQALATIARVTGGKAFSAATEVQLKQIYQNIGSSIGFETVFREIGLWFEGLALLLLFGSSTMSLLWFSRLP